MSRSGTRWRKHVTMHKGRHDRCARDVGNGFVFDFDRPFGEGCVPLADFVRRREEEIREARAVRWFTRRAPTGVRSWPLRNLTITVRTSSGETVTYEEPMGAVGVWTAVRFRHKGPK